MVALVLVGPAFSEATLLEHFSACKKYVLTSLNGFQCSFVWLMQLMFLLFGLIIALAKCCFNSILIAQHMYYKNDIQMSLM